MKRLFVGRLDKSTRTKDVEEVFESYGRLNRCEVKYGTELAYAFVEFEDDRDAEDALKAENGRKLCGATMVVEFSKGRRTERGGFGDRDRGGRGGGGFRGGAMRGNFRDDCYRCGRRGHFSRECPENGGSGYNGGGNGGGYGGGYGGGGGNYQRREPRRSRYSRSRSRSRSRSGGRRSRSSSGSPRRGGRARDDRSASPRGRRSESPKAANNRRSESPRAGGNDSPLTRKRESRSGSPDA